MATKAQAANGKPAEVEVPQVPIQLQPLEWTTIKVPIEGVTPVIPNRWSEKAKRMMRDKQQGKAVTRPPKDPVQEADDATYWCENGNPGVRAVSFKGATVDAARYFKGMTFELLKRIIFVKGEGTEQLVPLEGPYTMREDPARNSGRGGVADLRYRNQVWPWEAELEIEFLRSALTPESVVALVDAGGTAGVGDWRPGSPQSKTGTYGRYRVKTGTLESISGE
jgi:hypothetical protein